MHLLFTTVSAKATPHFELRKRTFRQMQATDLEELDCTVRRIREQNCNMAAENLIIKENLRLVSIRTQKIIELFADSKQLIEEDIAKTRAKMQEEVNQMIAGRKERKKALTVAIRQKTVENEKLENDIRSLQAELLKMKRLKDTLPKQMLKNVGAAKKKKKTTPRSPIRM